MDECLSVVRRQERLHRAELHKWQEIVHSVTALLRQSETALASLQVRTGPLAWARGEQEVGVGCRRWRYCICIVTGCAVI